MFLNLIFLKILVEISSNPETPLLLLQAQSPNPITLIDSNEGDGIEAISIRTEK